MAIPKTQTKQEPRVKFFTGAQTPRDTASAVEDITRRLDERRRSIAEHNRQAELEKITAEDEVATARLREEKREIDRRTAAEEAGGPGTDGQGGGAGGAKGEDARIWQVDEEKLRVRPVRQGDVGLTFNEAREIISEMKKGLDTQVVILDVATGKHVPNPQSEFARNNPQIALMTAKEYDKQLAGGKEPNAMEIFIEQKKQADQLKEALGIKEGANSQVDEVKILRDEIAKMREDSLKAEIGSLRQLVETKLADTGKETPAIAALRTQIQTLTDQLAKKEREELQAQIAARDDDIKALSTKIDQVAKEKSSDNEFGIMKDGIHTVEHGADKVVDLISSIAGQGGPKLPFESARSRVAAAVKAVEKPVVDAELADLEREILEGSKSMGGH